MGNVYEKIAALCKERGISPSRLCLDIGASKSLMTELKSGRSKQISLATATSIADYFSVPTDFLLGRPPFDCWELINANRKGFFHYVELDAAMLRDVWNIDKQDPDAASVIDMAVFLSNAIEDAGPNEDGDWIISLKPNFNKSAPALTNKDKRDIARDLKQIMESMGSGGDLMFDGVPMSEEAKASIMSAMQLGLEAAKAKNKARFTPKKYRGGK